MESMTVRVTGVRIAAAAAVIAALIAGGAWLHLAQDRPCGGGVTITETVRT